LFSGRLQHFIRLTSPLNLVRASEQGAIEKAQQTTARYIKHRLPLDERYWEARYLLNATIHPDTKQPIFLPFRMASFVPTNLLITAGLLLPAPSLSTIVFWQWVNQSANVGINWANANHSTKLSIEETAVAYATAVTASVSVAVGLNKVVRGPLLARFVPFVAVATAGALNVFLMRRKELTDGIDVCDEDGRVVGKSTAAGWRAVSQVAVSRVLTALPCLTLPPLVMSVFERTRLYARHRWLSFPLNFGI
jgi:tricarboxylate carrier